MKKIISANLPFTREEIDKEKALKIFASQPYKLELIDELGDEALSIYNQGSFVDLCRGPHINNTAEIGPFKLLSVAGAYWRGDENRPMLQRIYGTAFESQEALDEHLQKMEEAGVDISRHRSKHVREIENIPFDYVITVCGHAKENCPVFPGRAKVLHVGFDDPPKLAAAAKTEEERLAVYRRIRDEIRSYVEQLPEVLYDEDKEY